LIKTGKTYGDRVEVLTGLGDGERIVVDRVEALGDGSRIESI
jgi:multidrug efflux pump subunit AcrA (membrane-fusion protein)